MQPIPPPSRTGPEAVRKASPKAHLDRPDAGELEMPPRISIGLPVYNGERFLAEAIEGVLGQTFSDFELVISDNASTDRTQEISLEFCRVDQRIRYYRNARNIGAAPNYNRCFELARSRDYFKWIAYDDLMSDDFLEPCIAALDRDPNASIAFPSMVHANAEHEVTTRQLRDDLSLLDDHPGRRARRLIEYGLEAPDIYWSIYAVMRRSALEQTDLHGNYTASDQVFLFQLSLTGKFIQVSDGIFIRRAHPEAWTMRTDRTPKTDAVWFGSQSRSPVALPHWSLLFHHLRAVWLAELPVREKAYCLQALAHRTRREWRQLGGDVKLVLRELVRGRRRGNPSLN